MVFGFWVAGLGCLDAPFDVEVCVFWSHLEVWVSASPLRSQGQDQSGSDHRLSVQGCIRQHVTGSSVRGRRSTTSQKCAGVPRRARV